MHHDVGDDAALSLPSEHQSHCHSVTTIDTFRYIQALPGFAPASGSPGDPRTITVVGSTRDGFGDRSWGGLLVGAAAGIYY